MDMMNLGYNAKYNSSFCYELSSSTSNSEMMFLFIFINSYLSV